VIPFKNYGWWPEPPSNMATTVIKKRKLTKISIKKFWKILKRANCFQTSGKWYICDYLSELWLIALATIKHDHHHYWKCKNYIKKPVNFANCYQTLGK
jgi:hypothetical protein